VKSPKWLGIALIVLLCPALSGCAIPLVASVVDNLPWPQPRPYDAELVQSFSRTILKQSSSAEVLSTIHRPKDEILSQSESVLVSCGQKKNGRRKWLNAVAFDEDVLTARCKYLLIVTEAPPFLFPQWHKCRIDLETVMAADVLDKPYANESARRIAVLRQVLDDFNDDVRDVRQDNNTIDTSAMLVNQTINGILVQLEQSPAKASQLEDLAGLDFNHISLGRGKIRMVTRGDIIKVKIKIGSLANAFAKQQDVIEM